MKTIIGCATNQGRYREKNQDSVICLKGFLGNRELGVACVCDGIGSLKNSEVAANMMTEGITRWFNGIIESYPKDIVKEEIWEDLEMTIQELNEIIWDYRKNRNQDIGCTMSLVFMIENQYHIFHVGDSRIYILKDKLFQLTIDDIVEKEVNGKAKKLLSNYIGKQSELLISKLQGNIYKNDLFFVASDGVYKRLQMNDLMLLKFINQDKCMLRECHNLLDIIMERGEKDNLSCAIILFREE